VFSLKSSEFTPDAHVFDELLTEKTVLKCGDLEGRVIATPGHTPCSCSYVFGDAVFSGDTLFMPDLGSARAGKGVCMWV